MKGGLNEGHLFVYLFQRIRKMDQGIVQLMPLVLIGVVFYFLLIRPQQKKVKEHRAMVEAVRRGDSVVTAGGLMGKVSKVRDDNVVQIEIADGVKVNVVKSTLSEVRSKSEAADVKPADTKSDDKPASDGDNEKKGGLTSMFKK